MEAFQGALRASGQLGAWGIQFRPCWGVLRSYLCYWAIISCLFITVPGFEVLQYVIFNLKMLIIDPNGQNTFENQSVPSVALASKPPRGHAFKMGILFNDRFILLLIIKPIFDCFENWPCAFILWFGSIFQQSKCTLSCHTRREDPRNPDSRP